jgi:Tfp pilus assembly protein PilX
MTFLVVNGSVAMNAAKAALCQGEVSIELRLDLL